MLPSFTLYAEIGEMARSVCCYTLLHYSKINTMDIDISLTLMYNRTEYDFKAFSILEGEANEH